MDTSGREEVSRGAVFLVGVPALHIIGQQDDGAEDGLEPLSDLVPAVIRKLPGYVFLGAATASARIIWLRM
ncbi:hypothetical protein [Streptomyces javensis]|uniref:Uncharacterized protein n=3 Tax=Streptomyces javensis TaxID=114698 RepID=A0ABS0R9F2_9ACTN|nr:hypothetical protein [Streptomyces javensis]MBI0313999.1 hypothetical protein [Streptomyces javensis]